MEKIFWLRVTAPKGFKNVYVIREIILRVNVARLSLVESNSDQRNY